mgnify:CR=1 FL=1
MITITQAAAERIRQAATESGVEPPLLRLAAQVADLPKELLGQVEGLADHLVLELRLAAVEIDEFDPGRGGFQGVPAGQ